MKTTVKVDGLRELEAAMADLGKALSRGVMRRVADKALKPIADDAKARVQASTQNHGDLADSIGVSGRLSKRQARSARREGKSFVERYAGAGALQQATTLEFGTGERFHADGKSVGQSDAEPFMRPAWDAHKASIPSEIGRDLWIEIEKTAKRKAKRAAKQAAKGA